MPDYVCEAENGYFETFDMLGSEGGFRIAGKVTIDNTDDVETEWMPFGGVMFWMEDHKKSVGLMLMTSPDEDPAIAVRTVEEGSAKVYYLAALDTDKPLDFAMQLDQSGVLEITVDGNAFKIREFPAKPTGPVIMCSGGKYTFRDVTTSSWQADE